MPTKKKHIGKKEKNMGCHQPEPDERPQIDNAVSEMKAQNAAGVQ